MGSSLLLTTLLLFTSDARAWISRLPHTSSSERVQNRPKTSELWNGEGPDSAALTEIIGGGRIGGLFAEGGDCRLIGRDESIDPNGNGPILICTRNDALADIVSACPENRRKDLVFLQNGYLDAFLANQGLLDNTQALLFLSVTAKGASPVDGVTSFNPEGLTSATGLHAQAFVDRLKSLNLKCNVISATDYRPAMFEKLM